MMVVASRDIYLDDEVDDITRWSVVVAVVAGWLVLFSFGSRCI